MTEQEISSTTPFEVSLVGSFMFADALYFMHDEPCEPADGYLIASDALVSRMEQTVKDKHTPDELETFDNINFYPIYNLAKRKIQIEGTYWYWDGNEETQGAFLLPLSAAEQEDLIQAMEAYCIKEDSRNCVDMLNTFRMEDGLKPLAPSIPIPSQETMQTPSLAEIITARVTDIAYKTRSEMQALYGDDLAGHCIEASGRIAARLSSDLRIAAKTVEGWCQFDDGMYGSDRPWDPHTWVELPDYGLYVDVTADQFNYGMSRENEFLPVIVQKGLPHGMRYEEPSWDEYEREEPEDSSHLFSHAVSLKTQVSGKASFKNMLQDATEKTACCKNCQNGNVQRRDPIR